MTYISKLAVVAVLSIGFGVYVGTGMSSERTHPSAPAAYPTAEGVSYLPSQVVNQAKDIEPMAPTF
jgi:hypothetical protein